jgi:hypothetical protein
MSRSLAALQHALAAHVRTGDPAVAAAVGGTPGFPVGARLAVYRDAYRLRTAEALRADFPALLARLGHEPFDAMAGRYVARCPSMSFTLRDLGAGLAGYLRTARPYRARRDLAELAAFEWALRDAYDAADAPVQDAVALAALGAGLARYAPRLHPAVRAVALRWNTLAAWRAADAGEPPPPPQHLAQRVGCLVWRDGETVRFRSLAPDEAGCLRRVLRGGDFAALCATLRRILDTDAVPARAAALLARWAADGLLVADEIGPVRGALTRPRAARP